MPITGGDVLSPLEYQQHQMAKENDDYDDSSSMGDLNDDNSSSKMRQKLSRLSAKTTTIMGEGEPIDSDQSLMVDD